ncbi:MAG: carboxylate--amine ligase [Rhodoferax sp.]|uniref:carboxylate--amine ligase n=1 Tax=Rhodoferax sp. TaxID=50421 RepID=UPI002719B99E|nr:carboxylate--amine ligase [Rhodoferax sp.]MDO8450878.1 carboxylate--amine ligase [Rhodoferax sp.]
MHSRTATPGGEWAVVVGAGLNALGVVRSLGRSGVRVAVLAKHAGAPAMRSRYAVRRLLAADYAGLPERLLAAADELGGRPVLFLTEEEAVRVVSAARGRLQDRYRFRLGSHEVMLDLTHKEGVQTHAERHGLPIPRAVRLRSKADLGLLTQLRFPCVLKPGLKNAGYGARFKKAYVVKSATEAEQLFEEIAPVLPDLVVQEWIEGGDDAIYFCLQYIADDGHAVASFTGRKLRAWPPQIGGTASCMPAPEAEAELGMLTERFFAAVGFQGMGSMEYKRDVRDGRFYVVEPTVGRTDFQQEVATVNGNNLPYAAYCHECGLPVPEVRPTEPTIWREPTSDRWSEQTQGPHPAFAQYRVDDAYFRWDDLSPWLAMQWARVEQRWRKVRPWA